MNTHRLKHRLNRLKGQLAELEAQHVGNELNFTYWGGWSMGYLKGKIAEIEDILDEIEVKETKTADHEAIFKWLGDQDYLSDDWKLIHKEFKDKFVG